MRTRTLVKLFTWTEPDRGVVVLGPGTRLNAATHRATLALTGDGVFPTGPDLFVQSRATEPRSVRSWVGFEAVTRTPVDGDGVSLSSIRFRLHDGTDERYWDGGSWAVAGAGDWNTEQEVADNIAAWSVATLGQKMRVVANLVSTDGTATPELLEVRMAYEAVIDFQEDIIYRSLIPLMKAQIRPIVRVVKAMPATGTTLTLAQLGLETGYNVVGVDAVFDLDALAAPEQELMLRGFPGATPDLLLSFAAPTITLNASVAAGTNLYLRFIVEPEVHVWTSQEFSEPSRVPAIRLVDINLSETTDAPSGDCSVANRAAKTAIVVPSPQQGNLNVTLLGATDKAVDHQRLQEEINRFFANNPILTSTGLDDPYRLHLINEYEMTGTPGQNELHEGQATFQIPHFRRWLKDSFTDNIVAPPSYDGAVQSPVLGQRREGSIIEGRGPWVGAWTTEQAGIFQPPIPRYGGPDIEPKLRLDALSGFGGPGAGGVMVRESTGPLIGRAIGPGRVNKAIRFAGFARYQLGPDIPAASPVSGLPAFDDLMHFRLIIKDDGSSVAASVPYAIYFDDAGARLAFGRSGASDFYTEVLPGAGGLIVTAGIVPLATWMVLDVNYNYTTDAFEVFINGLLAASYAGPTPGRTKVKAGAQFHHYGSEDVAGDSTGITGLCQAVATARQITLAQHAADAVEAGV